MKTLLTLFGQAWSGKASWGKNLYAVFVYLHEYVLFVCFVRSLVVVMIWGTEELN